jgi:hypothetical protein
LQHQAYDNVLTEKERERDAFQSIAYYISQNTSVQLKVLEYQLVRNINV